jgi:hypothetical protein
MAFAVVAAVAAGASAISTYQQGQAQASQYRIQAQQAQLQGRQNALNYNMQANQIFERQLRLAATIRARAAAGGIDPMTGSPLTLDQMNSMRAGKEMQISMENAQLAISGGLAQSQALYAAADTTEATSLLSAIGQAGMSYLQYQNLKTPSAPSTSSPSSGTSGTFTAPERNYFGTRPNIESMGGGAGIFSTMDSGPPRLGISYSTSPQLRGMY